MRSAILSETFLEQICPGSPGAFKRP
jgi:hypothetical protein